MYKLFYHLVVWRNDYYGQRSNLIPDPSFAQQFNMSEYTNAEFFVIRLINFALWFLGIIMLAIIIGAGYMIITAGGNDEQVAKGRKALIGAIIGFIVIIMSYAIIMSIIYASDFLAPHVFFHITN